MSRTIRRKRGFLKGSPFKDYTVTTWRCSSDHHWADRVVPAIKAASRTNSRAELRQKLHAIKKGEEVVFAPYNRTADKWYFD